MTLRALVALLLCTCIIPAIAQAQDTAAVIPSTEKITSKYINAVAEKSAKLSGAIDKQTNKYLDKLQRQEVKLQNKLAKIDSLAAHNLFAESAKKYEALKQRASSKAGKYLPLLDTFTTSLKFLDKYKSSFAALKQSSAQIRQALDNAKGLESKLQQTDDVRQFIKERSRVLREQLQKYNLGKELDKFNKDAYYYGQQIKEYKDALNDADKIERKAIELLNKLPAFRSFMQKNSMLAAMFPTPENYGTTAALQGLQSRVQVQQLVQDRIAAGGPNAQNMIQQNLAEAHSAISKLKEKAEKLGHSNGNDLEMPDFKPNQQKTKSFLQRLEYGTNIQTVKNNGFFPVTSDIGLSAAYKLNDKSSIGLGASYKMGWGKDIKHIAITSEGIGLRSFADVKLKGSFYVSGGFEYNYQQPFTGSSPPSFGGGRGEAWQQSGLVGVSKIVSVKTKFFKKTKLQLLWDFLSYQQRPVTQPVKFRVGYSFN